MNDRLGSVEQTLSGRWRVRMSLAGVGRKTIDTFDTREEADAHCTVMADILKREQPYTGKTVLDFGHDVLTQREVGGHISDPGSDWSRWNNHIKTDEIANRAIRSVRDIHVEDWLERLNAKGISRQTRLHCLNLMRVIMHRAKKKRLIKENPCIGIRLEVEKRTIEPWTFATPEEQDALIAATPKPLDAIMEFAIGTGMRSGEMAALRLVDVHVDGADPYVTVRYGGPPDKPTKWGRIRQIPLFGRPWRVAGSRCCPATPRRTRTAFSSPRITAGSATMITSCAGASGRACRHACGRPQGSVENERAFDEAGGDVEIAAGRAIGGYSGPRGFFLARERCWASLCRQDSASMSSVWQC
jgi:hypothetical protein